MLLSFIFFDLHNKEMRKIYKALIKQTKRIYTDCGKEEIETYYQLSQSELEIAFGKGAFKNAYFYIGMIKTGLTNTYLIGEENVEFKGFYPVNRNKRTVIQKKKTVIELCHRIQETGILFDRRTTTGDSEIFNSEKIVFELNSGVLLEITSSENLYIWKVDIED